MKPAILSIVLLALMLFVAPLQGDAPATDAEFKAQIQKLDVGNDKATRLEALKWLNRHGSADNAALALPALERCLRNDPDPEVRRNAALDLGLIAKHLDKPCPLALMEAVLDKEDEVRWQAGERVYFFKSFAPGATEVLLRGVAAENPDVRSSCLHLLARVAGKDKKSLDAFEKAKQDKTLEVRHNAHIALFLATDKLDDFVAYLIRVREDPESILSPLQEDSEEGKRERTLRNLIAIGGAIKMIELSNKRPEELATILMKLLDDPSPVMRRGAANMIGAVVVKVELPEPPQPGTGSLSQLLPYFAPEIPNQPSKTEKRPEKSKVAVLLEKQQAEERLRHLGDQDKDLTVRVAARLALERWAKVQEKKP